jgi:CRISPR-associated endonuclease/helicase Cas3
VTEKTGKPVKPVNWDFEEEPATEGRDEQVLESGAEEVYQVPSTDEFQQRFEALTDRKPFPWQTALFERLVSGDVPSQCDIPTGLGKTSVLPIWLLALAQRVQIGVAAGFPRRLVYVVNRRTVVDQATREAESLLKPSRISDPRLSGFWTAVQSLRVRETRGLPHLERPVAISTLRGQFADNASWRIDPARPAIVLGTVDMIGSRLLFSAYGRGYKTKPLHAGFLAQNSLVVHDEAHLEPAFQELLLAIEREQSSVAGSSRDAFGRLRVMALTATSRGGESFSGPRFALTEADCRHDAVKARLFAKKAISLHPLDQKVKLADSVAEHALGHKESNQAILVFVRHVDDVQKVTRKLPKGSFATLTGTIRGHEREKLKKDPIFARFDPKSPVPAPERQQGTVYLVCTSAGEVGVDISADHLVCDLTPFDSMAQRFGRVNRFGEGDAGIAVVYEPFDAAKVDEREPFDLAMLRTLELFGDLPLVEGDRRSASPAALGNLPEAARRAAFSPMPKILAVTDILFDTWALTSIREAMPGRPPVADWLHGVAEWEPPETRVAWRNELERDRVPDSFDRRELLELYPLKPHELLRDTTKRVFEELKELMKRAPNTLIWIVGEDGRVEPRSLESTTAKGNDKDLAGKTILLPPSAGGLTEEGSFLGADKHRADFAYDVADEWRDENETRRRVRIQVGREGETPEQRKEHRGMRLVANIRREDEQEGEDAPEAKTWRWYVEPTASDEQGSRTAPRAQTLTFHLTSAAHFAREIVRALELAEPEASAIVWAASFHDLGKERRLWQRSIGNFDPSKTLAKSDKRSGARALTKYRHELGSLFDMEREPEFQRLSPDAMELARHAVAAHHGRARPSFPVDEVFDPSHTDAACRELAREVPRRFARLQRKYGRWGLAYLESLLRAADVLASLVADPSRETASVEAAE